MTTEERVMALVTRKLEIQDDPAKGMPLRDFIAQWKSDAGIRRSDAGQPLRSYGET